MGNTTVDYQGKEFQVAEGDLDVCMYLVGMRLPGDGDPDWLRELREDWLLQVKQAFGYGLMPMLDDWLGVDKGRRALLRRCLGLALVDLERWTGSIPAADRSALGMCGGGPPGYYSDWPVPSVRAALLGMIALVNLE